MSDLIYSRSLTDKFFEISTQTIKKNVFSLPHVTKHRSNIFAKTLDTKEKRNGNFTNALNLFTLLIFPPSEERALFF